MDSDEDMLDASDSELIYDEDYYYSEDGGDSDESDPDYDFGNKEEDDSVDLIRRRNERFTVLKEEDISQRQEEATAEVSNILSISKEHALILLRHFKWDASEVNDEWFANEESVRKSVGLLETPVEVRRARKMKCGICFEELPSSKVCDAECGHHYCFTCWQGYIGAAINGGPGCLNLRCPEPSCSVVVTQDLINKLAKDEDKEKYARFMLRSYVEDSRKTKWCPSPGCEFAVEFMIGNSNYDVCCGCSFSFCWNCVEEAHRPVDCSTVKKWVLKNSAESENMNWILANSKPCPKCKRPIEKNQGCMHMTCTPPCKFDFCWLCLGDWSQHGERTGGFYACNSYESAKKQGVYDEAERRREMAKNSLERYTHYYERWASNQTSRTKALADLNEMKTRKIAELSENIREPETQLKFIVDAWQQIVECRRVLKWTYAYGYYLPENETTKRQFFEYLQGEAESGLERLHMCAEKELQNFLQIEDPVEKPREDFSDFRVKLAGLTSVTKNYFENLVRALENGLEDVNPTTSTSQTSTSKNNKGKNGKNKSAKSGSTRSVAGVTDDDHWSCERCTLANPATSDTCQVCSHRL
ncbi:hypothetical protein LUZ60_015624 [Juncus effusus]|nr:hypothetical protein LUZ60_015624 [Juncus effusus]